MRSYLNKDFGREQLEKLIKSIKTPFPWLLSNLLNKENSKPLPPCEEYKIIKKNGLKIGVMGLIEYDWLAISKNNLAPEDYKFIDYSEKAIELIKLFQDEKCDLIIALTHMRNYNDM